ncbi:MAG TPA: carboxylesterase/lipase family protein [Rhizomicrobium sp.]|nr:carboxylesterase/lipase family protein [Rhizomicrobium sp.]
MTGMLQQAADAVVETAQGRVRGLAKEGVARFHGLPFAAAPTGARRWRPAEPPQSWAGVRDATRFGAIAPQVRGAAEALIGGTPGEQSEDCLYLNVWTPGTSGKRPVMVWIHGGAFVNGAGSLGAYNGRRLAARGDVVAVTINYRLGAFGFLNLGDATDEAVAAGGTEGLSDQIAALRWVKENIASFGGDPDNVTVFGESAGALSIGALLAMPSARGLFHKAILQSGGAHIGRKRDSSAKIARLFLKKLGLDAVRAPTAPQEALLRAQGEILKGRSEGGLPFSPTAGREDLSARAIEVVRQASARGIPLLAGTTREEWKLFTAARPRLRLMDAAKLRDYAARQVGDEHADALLSVYDQRTSFERWNALMTDRAFAVPAARLLEAQAPYAPVFAYRFDWRSPLLKGLLGSCHALELGFVFGTYNVKMAGAFFGSGPEADALSNAMMAAWIHFARSGDPACSATGPWPRYDADKRATMIFGDGAPHVVSAPDDHRRTAWDRIPEERIGL